MRTLNFSATKLNGFVLLLRPWSQDTVSGVTSATLLRGFERKVEEIAGLRTRYWVGGDGPPLVLVHGLGGAAWNFTDLAPLLAARHRVLVPDLPGHGGTEPLPQLESLSDLALHVAAVIEHEDMSPAAVLGYSMGGPVALRLGVERPEVVSSLVLVAAAGIVSTTRRAEVWLAAISALRPARKVARAPTSSWPGGRTCALRSSVTGARMTRASSPRKPWSASSRRSRSTRTSKGRRGRS